MMVQNVAKAGEKQTIPPSAVAVRFLPVAGLAAYPRTVKLGGTDVSVAGPDWWSTTGITDATVQPSDLAAAIAKALPFGGSDTFQGEDPADEYWLIEVAMDPCDPRLRTSSGPPRARRLLWSSIGREWGQNTHGKYSPWLDLTAFREVTLDSWTTSGNGWTGAIMLPDLLGTTKSINPWSVWSNTAGIGSGDTSNPKRTHLERLAAAGNQSVHAAAYDGGEGVLLLSVGEAHGADGTVCIALSGVPR